LPDKYPPERQKRRLLALQAALGSAPRALRRDACSGTSKASAAASTRSLARSAILVARASSSFSPATAAWPGSAPPSSPRSATTATKAAASACTACRRRPKPKRSAVLRHSQATRGRRAVSRPAVRQDGLCCASHAHGGPQGACPSARIRRQNAIGPGSTTLSPTGEPSACRQALDRLRPNDIAGSVPVRPIGAGSASSDRMSLRRSGAVSIERQLKVRGERPEST
jgi:hypothetical protein